MKPYQRPEGTLPSPHRRNLSEFTVPILTGEATTKSTGTNRDTDSTDTQGYAEVGASEEQPLYRTMSARLSDDQFMEDGDGDPVKFTIPPRPSHRVKSQREVARVGPGRLARSWHHA